MLRRYSRRISAKAINISACNYDTLNLAAEQSLSKLGYIAAVAVERLSVESGPVSIQTQSLALRALRKRKPQETQALAFVAVFRLRNVRNVRNPSDCV